MQGWDDLQQAGLFEFEEARGECAELFQSQSPDIDALELSNPVHISRDVVLLGAAAFTNALGTARHPDVRPQLAQRVSGASSRISFIKVDCSGQDIHSYQPIDSIGLSALLPFGGDVFKLHTLGVERAVDLAEGFHGIVDQLVERYQAGWWQPANSNIVEAGRLFLDAIIWQVTAWRVVDPVRIEAQLASSIDRYGAALRLPDVV